MKQIGARQEAGRIGGIGPCGRPLCCSQWMTGFVSVSTSAARFQDISLNPQKLAGQCAKLKCCLNFEVDAYVEATRRMPPRDAVLETADATYYHFKSDIFNRKVTYSTDRQMAVNLVTITADRVFEIIGLNKHGEKPLSLLVEGEEKPKPKAEFGDILGPDDDLARFDRKKKKKKKTQGQKASKPQQEAKADGGEEQRRDRKDGQKGAPAQQKSQHAAHPESRPRPKKRPKQRNNNQGGEKPASPGETPKNE